MRMMAQRYGAPLTFSGLMLDKSTVHRKVLRKPEYLLTGQEHPIGGQLLGSEPETMASAAKILQDMGHDIIDLNFACPAPKVLRRGRGGSLEQKPSQIAEIYRQVRQAVSCPVMMKLRIGYDETETAYENFFQICRQAAEDEVDALAIHGRTVVQKYRGKANWDIVSEIKRQFPNMTVIGSGDLFTAEDIAGRLASSGVDGVVIARGAIGNPWIFREAQALLEGREKPQPPTVTEQGQVIKEHLGMVMQVYPARKVVPYFRKFTVHYSKRHPERKSVLHDLIQAKTIESLQDAIEKWYCRDV
jgi:tRNA-dihydrouridine synthase B